MPSILCVTLDLDPAQINKVLPMNVHAQLWVWTSYSFIVHGHMVNQLLPHTEISSSNPVCHLSSFLSKFYFQFYWNVFSWNRLLLLALCWFPINRGSLTMRLKRFMRGGFDPLLGRKIFWIKKGLNEVQYLHWLLNKEKITYEWQSPNKLWSSIVPGKSQLLCSGQYRCIAAGLQFDWIVMFQTRKSVLVQMYQLLNENQSNFKAAELW